MITSLNFTPKELKTIHTAMKKEFKVASKKPNKDHADFCELVLWRIEEAMGK